MARGATDAGAPLARTAAVWLCLFALGFWLTSSHALDRLENARRDLFHHLAGVRCAPQHVAIVGIDEQALAARPDEPLVFWPPHLARGIRVLHEVGVKGIGVDLLLTVSPAAWLARANLGRGEEARLFDRPFRQALGAGGTVLIAYQPEDQDDDPVFPNPDYVAALPGLVDDLALANLDPDEDGVVRRFKVASTRSEAPRLTLGPALAARATAQGPGVDAWQVGGRRVPVDAARSPIPFCGPPGTVPQLSIDRLLAESAPSDPEVAALAGKTVLVAATYHAAQDTHATPYAPQLMHGAEIHAQIAEALLTGRRISALPTGLLALLLAALALLAAWVLAAGRGVVQSGLATAGAVLGVLLLSYVAWRFDVDLPTGGPVATLVAGWVTGLALGLRGSERRRAELKRMFGRYVSDDVVAHLLRSGTAPDLGGEEREVTVLFSDIRGFTTLSETLEAPAVLEMLNEWFSRINGALLDNGGTIDKYIGDAVMVVFGAPVAHDDHARRALVAASEMERQAGLMRAWLDARHPGLDLPPFQIGVGLHTGSAVSGNVGSPQRMEFTTIGDTVNVASRVEGLTKGMGATVVVSREVVEAAGGGLRLGEPQLTPVKGRAEPLEVMAFHGIESADSPDPEP